MDLGSGSADEASPSSAGRPALSELLGNADGEVLLLGLTPPRRSVSSAEAAHIAEVTLDRLHGLDLDGLVLYDIDDESDRNPEQRPFPYLPTMDPAIFHATYLSAWQKPVVVYRCVGKYPEDVLSGWLRTVDPGQVLSVFVGSSSSEKPVHTKLGEAHALRDQLRPELELGAVTITERYSRRGDEHLRMLTKQTRGCSFFISQVVYDVDATKSLISDYFYACADRGVPPRPVIFTLSVCGSLKTLAFLKWLGVDVPRWLENSLLRSPDPLADSYRHCVTSARSLIDFCRNLRMPFGFNVESVSIRKAEIEASVLLAKEIRTMLR
ncbi:5,10-methylenetetrahydrofolate reductase [Dactylosporangium sp. AC04546]|uniref:5,10-methylenetetrahydrofolate reductase n=1 Tax=Dactylosporangium sp. AC04546 TaxID=2862460 RepID=UPI001EE05C87|nr:5,10-methylenetetrahydrofolate reductase [Dactylosporangium sp. AC04546]WVK78571.1 5,10-methylenetetrahydrofolate reductase [Dactylosporangium sp. AC04546]